MERRDLQFSLQIHHGLKQYSKRQVSPNRAQPILLLPLQGEYEDPRISGAIA